MKAKIISRSVKQTLEIGRAIAGYLSRGDIVCLRGELGSGKTCLAKGIAWGLGIKPSRVVSPTFILIHRHDGGRMPLYHFDLYRLESPRDILDLGYEEYFYGDGLSVIEWPERLKYLLPKDALEIKLSIKGAKQRLFEFSGASGRKLREKIYEDIRH